MAKLFTDILDRGARSGMIPAKSTAARIWYREAGKAVSKAEAKGLVKESGPENKKRMAVHFNIGSMYMFYYFAKHRDTLPYYDYCPLVFPIGRAANGPGKSGFYGLNFHYLPLPLRAQLMDALYDVANNSRYDESTKLKVSYGVLAGAAKFGPFKPTFKHYLFSQIRSKLILVPPASWDTALFMPTAQFRGATQAQVWKDSKKAISG